MRINKQMNFYRIYADEVECPECKREMPYCFLPIGYGKREITMPCAHCGSTSLLPKILEPNINTEIVYTIKEANNKLRNNFVSVLDAYYTDVERAHKVKGKSTDG